MRDRFGFVFLTGGSSYVNRSNISHEVSSYWKNKRLRQRPVKKIIEKHFIYFCGFADFSFL